MTNWLNEILTVPAAEPSSFLAAVSFLGRLAPREAQHALQTRATALDAESLASSEPVSGTWTACGPGKGWGMMSLAMRLAITARHRPR